MPFAKGKSGNPGGRPKGIEARARELTKDGEDCLVFLVQVMTGKIKQRASIHDRIEAARTLLNRGFGREKQVVEVGGPDGGPVNLAGLREYLAGRIAGIAERKAAPPDPEPAERPPDPSDPA
jgi:hypothetical protein